MTPAEKQLLIEEFNSRKADIPPHLKGGSIKSNKLPQFYIHFRDDLSIGEIEEKGDGYIYHHSINK